MKKDNLITTEQQEMFTKILSSNLDSILKKGETCIDLPKLVKKTFKETNLTLAADSVFTKIRKGIK